MSCRDTAVKFVKSKLALGSVMYIEPLYMNQINFKSKLLFCDLLHIAKYFLTKSPFDSEKLPFSFD